MLRPGVVPAAAYETKICPCSLPPLDPTGAVTNDPARAPYWPLPNPAGGTLALYAGFAERVQVKDCAGIRPELIGEYVLARLDGTEPRYVLPPLKSATVDSYVADDCPGAAPFTLPPLATGTGGLLVAVANPADTVAFYVNLASSFSGALWGGVQEICADCGFDQGTCQPASPTARPTVQGPLYGRMTLSRSVLLPTDVVSDDVDIEPLAP